MNRHQRAWLLFGLLLISAAILGRAQEANVAQASGESGAGLESKPVTENSDRGLTLTLGEVLFEAGGTSLKTGATTAIDRLAQFMRDYPERTVRIEAHTDSAGSDASNRLLSERRAGAIRDALIGKGMPPGRVVAIGHGETHPIADNDTPAGRQQNRRVEVVVSDENGSFGDDDRSARLQ